MIYLESHHKKIEPIELKRLVEFVLDQNFEHHLNNVLEKNYQTSLIALYKEELIYSKNSEIFIAKDEFDNIVGSIRVLKWNGIDRLPLEKIFNINIRYQEWGTGLNSIFHIGRLAIRKEVRNLNLFKKLMMCAIKPVCSHPNGIAFAECDVKLLKTLNLLGIETIIIGSSINYLGSETIPIALKTQGLLDFYYKNIAIISSAESLLGNHSNVGLPKSLVFYHQ